MNLGVVLLLILTGDILFSDFKKVFFNFLHIYHFLILGIGPQSGRVAIVTGGGRGIGFQAARQFLALDMTVIIGM